MSSLSIDNRIVTDLSPIDVNFDENDSTNEYLQFAGHKFPVVQIANTVLTMADISYYVLEVGSQKLPTLSLTFNDSMRSFLESDLVEKDSTILVYMGHVNEELKPIKIEFEIVKCNVLTTGLVTIIAQLKLPDVSFDVYADKLDAMLQVISDKTKLGVKYEYEIETPAIINICDETVETVLDRLAEHLDFTWFIDEYYNIVVNDLTKIISKHQDTKLTKHLSKNIDLEKPETCVLNNANDKESQCKFESWAPSYAYKNADEYEYDIIAYDKSYSPDLTKEQVAEARPPKDNLRYDFVGLQLQMQFNLYPITGRTVVVEVYTTSATPKRIPIDGETTEKPTQSVLIEDYSGTFYVQSKTYSYTSRANNISQTVNLIRPIEE